MTLLLQVLGVFWAWALLRDNLLPRKTPDILKPFIVLGIAYALVYPDWLRAAAIAGAVAIITPVVLHFIPDAAPPEQVPNLRRGAAGRIPPLP